MEKLLEKYFDRLWPINRSLTGNGNRETLKILSEVVEMDIHEIPSGEKCFDWVVPPEWNVNEAYIRDQKGRRIIDFKNNNLHLVGYSIPFRGMLALEELKKHLHTLPETPTLIPYKTSYYCRTWGFCIAYNDYLKLKDEQYEIVVDTELNNNGSMTIGEAVLKGKSKKEILISTYICHPSLANNELSGPLVSAFLYERLKKEKNRYYSYRFVFAPETIGSLCYLSINYKHFEETLLGGLVLTCIGDPGIFTYKQSKNSKDLINRLVESVLCSRVKDYVIEEYSPIGSDERQYCSVGFNFPVGSLMRSRYYKYKEYHTSADNKDFISFKSLKESVEVLFEACKLLENNFIYNNNYPYGEPQLGKRDLYPPKVNDRKYSQSEYVFAIKWILAYSDGATDLLSIIEKSKIPYDLMLKAATLLHRKKIISTKKSH